MKKRILILSVLALFLSASARAYDFIVDGIYYRIVDGVSSTCEVTFRDEISTSNVQAYIGDISIPENVIGNGTTYSVIGIGEYAFYSCYLMTSITLPKSVTAIGTSAFYGCSNLKELYLPEGVSDIVSSNPFMGCSNLTKFEVADENGVYTAKDGVLYTKDMKTLAIFPPANTSSFVVPESVTTIGNYAFTQSEVLNEVTLPDNVISVGGGAFQNCTSLSNVNLGSGLITLGSFAFYNCYKLSSITIPNGVTEIESMTFENCINLTELNIGSSVTTIGEYAFNNCSKLTEVIIPNSVTTLGYDAFDNCTSLTSLYIGSGMSFIGMSAFRMSSELATIYSLNPTPPTCANYNPFLMVNTKECVLYVPKGGVNSYSSTWAWNQFKNIVEIETDAISDIHLSQEGVVVDRYTIDGKQVPTMQRGINIIRYSDGTAKKVLVR